MIPANGFATNASLIFQSVGFDAMGAATMLSVFSGASIIWVLAYGVLSDKLGARKANLFFTVLAIISVGVFAVMGNMTGAIILACTVGVVSAYAGMLGAVTYRTMFGTKAIGALIPLTSVASGVGSMIAPPIATAINAATGGYTGFMLLCVIVLVIVFVLIFTSTTPKMTEKIKAMMAEDE